MSELDTGSTDIREHVSKRYGEIAQSGGASCCCGPSCDTGGEGSEGGGLLEHAQAIGYQAKDLASLPQGANLGLGCGSPTSLTLIKQGMTVVDLGSGAGIDCFLASPKVGPSGRVIGVDMTDAMLAKARSFASEHGYENIEFRQGVIEKLPLDDESVDLVISNCVINLSPDKAQVFNEIARVLKPGGQAAISDIVLLKELPKAITEDIEAYIGCLAGAELMGDYLGYPLIAGLKIESSQQKGYDVMSVLGCSPQAGKLLANVPKGFAGHESIAALDLLVVKPSWPQEAGGGCCGSTGCC